MFEHKNIIDDRIQKRQRCQFYELQQVSQLLLEFSLHEKRDWSSSHPWTTSLCAEVVILGGSSLW
jgi:hypothetical protein